MREIHYDEARVPAYTLPEVLRFGDGGPVDGAGAWARRRGELLRLFEGEVYGATPPALPAPTFEVWEERGDALGGRALRRQVRITAAGAAGAVGMDLLVHLPAGAGPGRRAPVVVGLNFGGNHTVAADPAVRLPASWVRGTETHRASDGDRGSAAGAWPLERILARGYGVATMYYGDIEPDHPDGFAEGVRGRLAPAGAPAGDGAWGALGAWAWGLSRVCDYLRGDSGVDAGRVAVMGHSRLGKAALWAGAQDERFSLVISNNSGCGGAALFRREFGESIARINASFPHWFCRAFRRYDDREQELPVDQHMLLALVAPRPVYVASAEEDHWADPRGEFLAAVGADPVYRLLGREGIDVRGLPAPNRSVGGAIGYHIRPGGHGVTPGDWDHFLDFADRHLRGAGAG